MFVMIIYKIYRKIRYHASLYDWKRMRNYNEEVIIMDISVIILGVSAVGAGIGGFIMEHSGGNDNDRNNDKHN